MNILKILIVLSFFLGLMVVLVFYNISSSWKRLFAIKISIYKWWKIFSCNYKNGLWIKDKVGENIHIVNSYKIENNYLINNFITIFDKDFKIIKNIKVKLMFLVKTGLYTMQK